MKNEEVKSSLVDELNQPKHTIDSLHDYATTKDLVQFFDSELNSIMNRAKLQCSLDNATLYGALLLVLTDNLIESVGRSSTKELFNIASQVVHNAQDD